jgi:hypothetical protein
MDISGRFIGADIGVVVAVVVRMGERCISRVSVVYLKGKIVRYSRYLGFE